DFQNDDDAHPSEADPAVTHTARASSAPRQRATSGTDSAIMDELALDLMGSLPWQSAPAFLADLDDAQRLCLLTWLWLWDVWDSTDPYDLYARDALLTRYRTDPWEGVKNVVG